MRFLTLTRQFIVLRVEVDKEEKESKTLVVTNSSRKTDISQSNMPSNKISRNQEEYEDRVVTDSVHERFRQTRVRCDDCNRDFPGNEAAIRKHFNNSHPSDRHCCYCKGKVFMYREMTVDSGESSESVVYHKCQHNKQLETDASKEST